MKIFGYIALKNKLNHSSISLTKNISKTTMKTLNIRVIELICSEKLSSTNSFQVCCHTSLDLDKISKIKILSNDKDSSAGYKGDKPIQFEIPTQKEEFIYVYLKRHRLLLKDEVLGKLSLPMSWFPTNHIVREWFPFKASPVAKDGGMILLDVHFDARNVNPFMAPFAALRVYPNWTRPTLTENADYPIIPPIVYIIPSTISNQNAQPTPPSQPYQYPPQGHIYAPQYYPMPTNSQPPPYSQQMPPPPHNPDMNDSKLNKLSSDSESEKEKSTTENQSAYTNPYYQPPNNDSMPQFAMPAYPPVETNQYPSNYQATVF